MGKGRGEGKVTSVLDVQSLFLIKENRICSMTRHHAKNILLARNFPFNSDVRQWSHSLMIPFHYLWVKSNNRTRVQFEYDVPFCCCCFFVWFRSFTFTWRLLFHSLFTFSSYAMKHIDCKMSSKKLFLRKHFAIFLDSCTHENVKSRKSR